MPTTRFRNVTWEEVIDPGFGFGFDAESGTATRGAYVTDANLNRFIEDMLGFSTIFGGRLFRRYPEVHPRWPWLYAQRVEFLGPFGEPTEPATGARYSRTLIRITYAALPYEVIAGGPTLNPPGDLQPFQTELHRYIVKSRTYAVESVATPSRGFEFVTGGGAADGDIPENPPKLMMSGELTYAWMQIPAEQLATGDWVLPTVINTAISNCSGKVNNAVFDSRYLTETLLCLAPHIEPTRMSNGKQAFNVNYKFAIRDTEGSHWNSIYRGGSINTFQRVRRKGVGPPDVGIYQTADFNTLFEFS